VDICELCNEVGGDIRKYVSDDGAEMSAHPQCFERKSEPPNEQVPDPTEPPEEVV
jgi:hypothetical protein